MLYYGSKLSENISIREPEGYLYCLNVPIARTGKQPYSKKELGLQGEGIVQVIRTPEEVFSEDTISSFEGMPVCDDHPFQDVDTGNISAYGKGHVQNVRQGQGTESDLLLGDLVITHKDLIDAVLHGKREISCGYNCSYLIDDDGNVYQRAIRGNHVAVVDNGRAGSRVAIRDAAPEKIERRQSTMSNPKKPSIMARMIQRFVKDSDPDEGAQVIDELMENGEAGDQLPAPAAPAPAPQADGTPVPAAPAAPAAPAPVPQNDEGAPDVAAALKQLTDVLMEIKAAVCKPAPDPLDSLEKELSTTANESSVTVPADQLHDDGEKAETGDEDPTEEKPTEDCSSTNAQDTNAALLTVLKGMRGAVAALPEAQRQKVSDSMEAAIRKASGLTPEEKTAGAKKLAKIAAGKNPTRDSAPAHETDDSDYGRTLMRKHNPHYREN